MRLPKAVTLTQIGQSAGPGPFSIQLHKGWNSVGDPFPWAVASGVLRINGVPYPQAASGSSPTVSPLWDYNSAAGQYNQASSLLVGRGIWIWVPADSTLTIPSSPSA